MSASSKKKLRKEQAAATMTQKQQAAAKEAKKLKIYTLTFWVILALCVSLVAGVALKSPITGIAARMTTALVVGDHKVSAVELNYFYIDAIQDMVSQYGNYISITGLKTNAPLSEQILDKEAGTTWADSFLDQAIDSAKNTYALYDAAVKAGHTLSDEEKKSMETLYSNMDVYAKYYNYSNANQYLASVYGDGANTKTYKEYYEVVIMASSYYAAYAEDLKDSYDDPALREFEKDEPYKYNSYTFAHYYLDLNRFKFGGTKDDKGNVKYSEAELKAALEYIEKVAKDLSDPEIDTVEELNEAIKEMEKQLKLDKEAAEKKDDNKTEETKPETKITDTTTEGDKTEGDKTEGDKTEGDKTEGDKTEGDKTEGDKTEGDKTEGDKTEGDKTEGDKDTTKYSTATENEDLLYSKISTVMQEWLRNTERKEGEITALKNTKKVTGTDGKETEELTGYYIVLYKSVNDNKFALANVRHILVAFEGGTTDKNTGKKTYTDAEKKKAKDEAEKILNEWLKGEKTEDSFAKLAKEKTDDSNGDKGGLYEDIYPGQMVDTFNDWCFDEKREKGDYGTVETEYGYHIMFYSDDSKTNYRDYMIINDKQAKDMEDWNKSLNDAMTVTEKNTKFVNKNYIISSML